MRTSHIFDDFNRSQNLRPSTSPATNRLFMTKTQGGVGGNGDNGTPATQEYFPGDEKDIQHRRGEYTQKGDI